MTQQHYGRHEYQAAKQFIADAVDAANGTTRINFSSPTYKSNYWRKPDGSIWLEWEEPLDGIEWDYGLDIVEPKAVQA